MQKITDFFHANLNYILIGLAIIAIWAKFAAGQMDLATAITATIAAVGLPAAHQNARAFKAMMRAKKN